MNDLHINLQPRVSCVSGRFLNVSILSLSNAIFACVLANLIFESIESIAVATILGSLSGFLLATICWVSGEEKKV